jgi:predicted DNA-binding transcriptional regulator AlpA
MSEWMTLAEVLDHLGGVSRSTFDEWRVSGRAPRCKKLPNGKVRVRRSDLEAWLDALPEAA